MRVWENGDEEEGGAKIERWLGGSWKRKYSEEERKIKNKKRVNLNCQYV